MWNCSSARIWEPTFRHVTTHALRARPERDQGLLKPMLTELSRSKDELQRKGWRGRAGELRVHKKVRESWKAKVRPWTTEIPSRGALLLETPHVSTRHPTGPPSRFSATSFPPGLASSESDSQALPQRRCEPNPSHPRAS